MTPVPLLIGLCVKKVLEKFWPTEKALSSSQDQGMNSIVKGTSVGGKFNNNPANREYGDTDFKESESKIDLTKIDGNAIIRIIK